MLLEGERLVKTKQFEKPRVVGNPLDAAKVYSDQDADELTLLCIDKDDTGFGVFMQVVSSIATNILTPITIGGHISSIERADEAFRAGADKVLINSAALESPELIQLVSAKFGSQSVVLGVDYRVEDSKPVVYARGGAIRSTTSLQDHLKQSADSGAGELLLQSIDRDGMRTGLDLVTAQQVRSIWPLPLVLAGGVGDFDDLLDGFQAGAEGLGCGTLFNFGDNNPIRAKAYLRNHNIPLKSSS